MIQMLDKIFGHDLLKNAFFRGLSPLYIVYLLNHSKRVHLNAGEHIYKLNQNVSHGRPDSSSVLAAERKGELSAGPEHLLQEVRGRLVLRRHRVHGPDEETLLDSRRSPYRLGRASYE